MTLALQDFYRTTLSAEETDPTQAHDLRAMLDKAQVYAPDQVRQVVDAEWKCRAIVLMCLVSRNC